MSDILIYYFLVTPNGFMLSVLTIGAGGIIYSIRDSNQGQSYPRQLSLQHPEMSTLTGVCKRIISSIIDNSEGGLPSEKGVAADVMKTIKELQSDNVTM